MSQALAYLAISCCDLQLPIITVNSVGAGNAAAISNASATVFHVRDYFDFASAYFIHTERNKKSMKQKIIIRWVLR